MSNCNSSLFSTQFYRCSKGGSSGIEEEEEKEDEVTGRFGEGFAYKGFFLVFYKLLI